MSGLDFTNAYWKLCQSEHDELCDRLRGLRATIEQLRAAPEGPREDFARLLSELRDHLRGHFAQEEQGGYMEEALSRAPRFSALAAELERQHPLLLGEATQLAQLAGVAPASELTRLLTRAQEFCAALARHEGAEARILQSAFNRDPIVGEP